MDNDHIIESNFVKEVLDRANRRIRRMVTRFSLKSQDADVKKIDEDWLDSDDLG
ncbi:hypothetical protein ES703_117692 [subsurface metagenome]